MKDILYVILSSIDDNKEHNCASVTCSGDGDSIEILPNHQDISIKFNNGKVKIATINGEVKSFAVGSCSVMVVSNKCTIVADKLDVI
ncbi:MAG: hypothetical protein JJW01_01510 [Alphaproteobacteria bacterium]|nr:hypothetical protein [Rickettsiales bacterium]